MNGTFRRLGLRLVRLAGVLLVLAALCAGAAPSLASDNFVGADSRFCDRAETARRDVAVFLTDKPLPYNWHAPCRMSIEVWNADRHGGGGQTTFAFGAGQVFDWNMGIKGDEKTLLESVIPHEVCHTILASIVRHPLPRWLDEGTAMQFESASEHARFRAEAQRFIDHPCSVANRIDSMDYPNCGDMQSVEALYSTGFTLVEWMLEHKDRYRLMDFIKDERPPSQKFEAHYGFSSDAVLARWRRDLLKRENPRCAAGCSLHGYNVDHPPAKSLASNVDYAPKAPLPGATAIAKPTLLIFKGTSWICPPCIALQASYDHNRSFRNSLNDLATVQIIDVASRPDLVSKYGIKCVPAFVLIRLDGTFAVKFCYCGPTATLTAVRSMLYADGQAPPPPDTSPPPVAQQPTGPPTDTTPPIQQPPVVQQPPAPPASEPPPTPLPPMVIKGKDGANGRDGKDGSPGRDGAPGKDGIAGPSGPAGAATTPPDLQAKIDALNASNSAQAKQIGGLITQLAAIKAAPVPTGVPAEVQTQLAAIQAAITALQNTQIPVEWHDPVTGAVIDKRSYKLGEPIPFYKQKVK